MTEKKKKRKGGASKKAGDSKALGKGMQILDPYEGRFCLTIIEPESDAVRAVFEQHGLQGSGYTWEGIVKALVSTHLPDSLDDLDIGAEGDNMYVYSADRALLETIAKHVGEVAGDPKAVKRIVADADNEIE